MTSETKTTEIKIVKSKAIAILLTFLPLVFITQAVANSVENYPVKDPASYFSQVKEKDLTGLALKAKPVYARLAKSGEIITTKIKDQIGEQQSTPAQKGDWVVETICPATGNEQRLLDAKTFNKDYGEPFTLINKPGYLRVVPQSIPQNYYIVPESDGIFVISTSENAQQLIKPGDILLQSADNHQTLSWIAKAAFPCSYEIIQPAKKSH